MDSKPGPSAIWGVTAIAAAIALLHCLTNGRYGFHRDELQFLADARHLDWGYVAYPPFTAFVQHVSMTVFGLWIPGLRLASVLAQCAAIFLTAGIARALGAGRLTQLFAALAAATGLLPLFEGTEFQYTTFDYLWWVLTFYALTRLVTSGNPRWWLLVGTALGLGCETKYAIAFFILSVLAAVVLTPARTWFASRWFWAGVGVTTLIALPNLLWLIHHDFISYHFLQSIHARDVRNGRGAGFWLDQLKICFNPAALPLVLVGLASLVRTPRFRVLALAAILPILLLALAHGRGYYSAAVYPMLIAAGSVTWASWLATRPRWLARTLIIAATVLVLACATLGTAIIVPLAASGPLQAFALSQNGDLREELGWQTLVDTLDHVRSTLPAADQQHLAILTGNYGEAGAVEILGPARNLPPVVSGTNSFWLRGYPTPPPTRLLVVGFDADEASQLFNSCQLAATVPHPPNLNNEESRYHPDIFLCGTPRLPWPDFWRTFQRFG